MMLKDYLETLSRTIGNLAVDSLGGADNDTIPEDERNKIIDQTITNRQIKEILLSKS